MNIEPWIEMSKRQPMEADFMEDEWAVEVFWQQDNSRAVLWELGTTCKFLNNQAGVDRVIYPTHWRKVRLLPPPSRLAKGHNPVGLTEEQVGVKDGWRLLGREEIGEGRNETRDIEAWRQTFWGTSGYVGNATVNTYRTRLPYPVPFKREEPPVLTQVDVRRCWQEDFDQENGQYNCECCVCHNVFVGNKHRIVCKLCAKKEEPPQPTTPEQQDEAAWQNALNTAGAYDWWPRTAFHSGRHVKAEEIAEIVRRYEKTPGDEGVWHELRRAAGLG
jgi:hypothetical protein